MANHLAVTLDRSGLAEMSCIAGVGGDVPSLVKVATSAKKTGRPILSIDGCALRCVKAALARHGVEATLAFELHDHGVKKFMGHDFDPDQAAAILTKVMQSLPGLGGGTALS